MYLVEIEQRIALQLEQSIYKLYLALKREGDDPEQFKDVCVEWQNTLLQTAKLWQILFMAHKASQFSFWLKIYKDVYDREKLCLVGTSPNLITDEKLCQELVSKMLKTLIQFFKSSSFLECLTDCREKQNKRFNHFQTKYLKLSNKYINCPHEDFYLSIQADAQGDFDIQCFMHQFWVFKKEVEKQPCITSTIIAYFYHIHFDRKLNRYGVILILILNQHLRLDRSQYLDCLSQTWMLQTYSQGQLFSLDTRDQPFLSSYNQIFKYDENEDSLLSYLEYLHEFYFLTDIESNHLIVLPYGVQDMNLIVV